MNTTAHVLVDEYLARLHAAARDLPASEGRDLIESIEDHIAAGLDELGGNEAAIRTMIDDLGDPERIVIAARGSERPPRMGFHEHAAVFFLSIGSLVFLAFPFSPLIGLFLLWTSPRWTPLSKVIGLAIPGGLISILFLVFLPSPTGAVLPLWIVGPVLAASLVAPIVATGHLFRSARPPDREWAISGAQATLCAVTGPPRFRYAWTAARAFRRFRLGRRPAR